MVKVKVKFSVRTNGVVRQEEMETQVDRVTLSKAKGDIGRKQLEGWAKMFFPTADWAKVTEMREIK